MNPTHPTVLPSLRTFPTQSILSFHGSMTCKAPSNPTRFRILHFYDPYSPFQTKPRYDFRIFKVPSHSRISGSYDSTKSCPRGGGNASTVLISPLWMFTRIRIMRNTKLRARSRASSTTALGGDEGRSDSTAGDRRKREKQPPKNLLRL